LTRFECYVGQPPMPVTAAHPQWSAAIPVHRRATSITADGVADTAAVTYGEYFTAACDFLSADAMAVPALAIRRCLGSTVAPAPEVVRIHLVKHGAMYHPARVTLVTGQTQVPLVLNVAISPEGRERLPAEVAHLTRLQRDFPETYVPEVYGWGRGATDRQAPLPMFAGQWLAGYHEVHRTTGDGSGRQQWIVWDSDAGPWRLSRARVADFFRQAVFILTFYFDPYTLHAIMEWHHAAGDFVLKRKSDGNIEVRLITVRRYGPLFHQDADAAVDLQTLLGALTVFFLRTSLWMRLDRLEGTGALVWSEDGVVPAMWEGFVRGLGRLAGVHHFPESFADAAVRYVAAHDRHDLRRLGLGILERYPADLPETALIRRHLGRHAARLASVIRGSRTSR
jgi:hypothetical protein